MKKTKKWDSIYQKPEYFETMQELGYEGKSIEIQGKPVYFYYKNNEYIAWETDGTFESCDLLNGQIYTFTAPLQYRNDSYITIAINCNNVQYSKRLMRAIKKFKKTEAQYQYGFMDILDERVFDLFQGREFLYQGMRFEQFKKMVKTLFERKLLKVSYIFDCKQDCYRGAIFVLVSDTIANLRYYYCEKEHNIGHFLHVYTIETLLKEERIEWVDLSGFMLGRDEDLKGIDEFKSQFGGKIIEFRKV